LAPDPAHPTPTVPAASDIAFRNAMSRLASGVTVLTCLDPMGRDCALTVTAVTSVSREPALVLVCVKQDGFTHDAMSVSDGWVLNMLSTEQLDLSTYAARHRAPGDRDDLRTWFSHRSPSTGAAVLTGTVATVECVPYSSTDGGDHNVMIGRVVAATAAELGTPMVHVDRGYWDLGTGLRGSAA